MRAYIEKFERCANKFRSVGGILEVHEEKEQFRTSLPGSYDHIRDRFSLLREEDRTYEAS